MKKKPCKSNALRIIAAATLVFCGTSPMMACAGDNKSSEQYPADNSGRNVRDAKGGTLTPEDQSGNEADRKLTQRVRQAIIDDKGFSVNAQNVKIITVNGKVTLRGPVNSPSEKMQVVGKARQMAGMENVADELEIAPQ